MERAVRYQGAIVEDGRVLLIRYRDHATGHSFWLVPGGGLEAGETEEECVRREMREETNLEVRVQRLLLDTDDPGGVYPRLKTYLCRVESGAPSSGYEPGPPVPDGYGIVETGWFSLAEPETWGDAVHEDAITRTMLLRIRAALGYDAD